MIAVHEGVAPGVRVRVLRNDGVRLVGRLVKITDEIVTIVRRTGTLLSVQPAKINSIRREEEPQ